MDTLTGEQRERAELVEALTERAVRLWGPDRARTARANIEEAALYVHLIEKSPPPDDSAPLFSPLASWRPRALRSGAPSVRLCRPAARSRKLSRVSLSNTDSSPVPLQFHQLSVTGHHDVEIDRGAKIFLVAKVEHRLATDEASTRGCDGPHERRTFQFARLHQSPAGQFGGHVRTSYRGGPRPAVCL